MPDTRRVRAALQCLKTVRLAVEIGLDECCAPQGEEEWFTRHLVRDVEPFFDVERLIVRVQTPDYIAEHLFPYLRRVLPEVLPGESVVREGSRFRKKEFQTEWRESLLVTKGVGVGVEDEEDLVCRTYLVNTSERCMEGLFRTGREMQQEEVQEVGRLLGMFE